MDDRDRFLPPTGSKAEGELIMEAVVSELEKPEELVLLSQKLTEVVVDKPLLSIIINNYNYGLFLRQAIDSALNQTYSNTEVIVVDDGSTDNSQEIIRSYNNQIIAVLKQNGGQASALNAGFAASCGEIVIFLDADDYLSTHTAEQVVAAWKPGVAKAQYLLKVIDVLENPLGFHPTRERRLDGREVWRILLERGRYGSPVTTGNAFSRTVLAQILPIPEVEFRICADGYLVNLVPFYGQIISIDEALGTYRLHGNNLWALTNTLEVEWLRKVVWHDLRRYELIACMASKLEYAIPKDLSSRDEVHLRHRIASLRLDPQNHSVPSDSLFFLICRGLYATWRYSGFNWKNQLIFSLWFVWVGLMPLPMAKLAITWLYLPRSRPKILNLLLKKSASSQANRI